MPVFDYKRSICKIFVTFFHLNLTLLPIKANNGPVVSAELFINLDY